MLNDVINKFILGWVINPSLGVKSVRVWSFSGMHFPAFGLNMERYSVSLRIQSECGKIGTRKTPNTYIFHAVHFISLVYFYTSWKHKKQRFSDVFGLERDHWHEIRNQVFLLCMLWFHTV